LTRYLLGQVSPEERADFENQYLDDDELFHKLIATKNYLIDSYVRGNAWRSILLLPGGEANAPTLGGGSAEPRTGAHERKC